MQTSNVVLHIGYPKAASTWLQQCVFTPEFGFQIPWPTYDNMAIEHFVLTPRPSFDATIVRNEFLSACKEDGGTPVISHEVLVGDPVMGRYHGFETAERLAATFPGARVVSFFRAQESYAYSAWGEHIKRGGVTPLEAYVGLEGVRPGYRPLCPPEFLQYDKLLGYYAEMFGRDNLLALPMESLRSGEALPYLAKFLNNNNLLKCKNTPVYPGLKGTSIRILRNFNRLSPYDPTQRTNRNFIMRQTMRIDRRLPRSWHDACRKSDQKKINALLQGRFTESNRRLQELTPVELSQFGYQLT